MNKYIFLLIFLVVANLLPCCEVIEKDRFINQGNIKGTIRGIEQLQIEYHPPVLLNSAEIKFDRGDKIFTAFSDENGNFELENIPYGTYNITISRLNYLPQTAFGCQLYFTDKAIYIKAYLSLVSNVSKIENIEFFKIGEELNFYLTTDGDMSKRHVFLIFYSKSENVSYMNSRDNYQFIDGDGNQFTDVVSFPYTDSFYYAIYAVSGFSIPEVYIDELAYKTRIKAWWINEYDVEFNPNPIGKGRYIGN